MPSNSKIQVDYTTKTRNFQLVFPINFEINIPADDSVRLLSNVLEELDYTELYRAYSRKEKNNAVSPKNLFKVIVAYMNNIYSSTADAGYESEENYTYFENNGQKACIKPANYEQSKTRKYRNDIGRAENMQYDEKSLIVTRPFIIFLIRICRCHIPRFKRNDIYLHILIFMFNTIQNQQSSLAILYSKHHLVLPFVLYH